MTKNIICLFVHDHKFKINKGNIYSEGKITNEVLSRYVGRTDKTYVLSRMENVEDVDGLSQITLKNVMFNPIKGLNFSKVISIHLLENVIQIRKLIKKADFLVVRSPSFLGLITLTLNLFHRKKYFIELVGDPKEALLTAKKNPNFLYKNFVSLISACNKFFIYNASGVIYVTERALQEKYPTLGLSSHASNVEVSIKAKDLEFGDFSNNNEYFKIGLIGSFNNHYKGIKEAIEAINILHKKNYKLKLHILGSGTLQNYYENLLKELHLENYIIFDGILSGGEEVINWLETLDLYIQPSYTEGLPRALIEAMSVGLPAIATNVGGIPELLSPDNIINPHDSTALALKIENLINSQHLRFYFGKLNYMKSKEYDKQSLKKRRNIFWNKAREIVSTL